MIIKNATLLSVEEFFLYKSFITTDFSLWWLKDTGEDNSHGCFVYGKHGKTLNDMPINVKNDVRPALIVEDLVAFPGDKIKIFDYTWTVLNNSLLLCDDYIGKYRFDEKTNDWHHSELKQFLDKWLKEQAEKTEEIICIKNPTEFLLLESLYKKYGLNKIVFGYNGDCEAYFLFSPYTYSIQITHHDMMRHRKSPITFAEFCNLITGEKTDDY